MPERRAFFRPRLLGHTYSATKFPLTYLPEYTDWTTLRPKLTFCHSVTCTPSKHHTGLKQRFPKPLGPSLEASRCSAVSLISAMLNTTEACLSDPETGKVGTSVSLVFDPSVRLGPWDALRFLLCKSTLKSARILAGPRSHSAVVGLFELALKGGGGAGRTVYCSELAASQVSATTYPSLPLPAMSAPAPRVDQMPRARPPPPVPMAPGSSATLPSHDDGQSQWYTNEWAMQILTQLLTIALTLLVIAVARMWNRWTQKPVPTTGPGSDVPTAAPASTGGQTGGHDDGPAKSQIDKKTIDPVSPAKDKSVDAAPSKPVDAKPAGSKDGQGTDSAPPAQPSASDPGAKKATGTGETLQVTPKVLHAEITKVRECLQQFSEKALNLLDGAEGLGSKSDQTIKESESTKREILSVLKYLAASDKDIKDVNTRLTAMEAVLGQLNGRVQTIGTNFDSMAKTQESLLKDIQKHLTAIGGAAKSYSSDTQLLIGVKHDNLEGGIKEILKQQKHMDYENHSSVTRQFTELSKQTDGLGQELLAALHLVQSEQASHKDNIWQVAQVLADAVDQVRTIKDYCERPVPVAMQSGGALPGSSAPLPPMAPPNYEPSIPGGRQHIHLQTALPVSRPQSSSPQVTVDMGDGRSINIPVQMQR